MSTALDAATTLLLDLGQLQLAARSLAHGALVGLHRSPRRGASSEFSEHTLYAPGDDPRHLDWRAYAKTERFYIKRFADETNLRVHLLVDASGSMGYAGGTRPSKFAVAQQLAAALAHIALRQRDAAGLTLFGGSQPGTLPTRSRGTHWEALLRFLLPARPGGPSTVAAALRALAARERRRGLILVLSDLFERDLDLWPAFRGLAARGHDVRVLHILDPDERSLPQQVPSQFVCLESGRRLFVTPRTLRAAYVAQIEAFLRTARHALQAAGMIYCPIDTGAPLAAQLRPCL